MRFTRFHIKAASGRCCPNVLTVASYLSRSTSAKEIWILLEHWKASECVGGCRLAPLHTYSPFYKRKVPFLYGAARVRNKRSKMTPLPSTLIAPLHTYSRLEAAGLRLSTRTLLLFTKEKLHFYMVLLGVRNKRSKMMPLPSSLTTPLHTLAFFKFFFLLSFLFGLLQNSFFLFFFSFGISSSVLGRDVQPTDQNVLVFPFLCNPT